MKRVCVYCGSSTGSQSSYLRSADKLAAALLDRGIGLVYGGASIGLMGRIADAMLTGDGEVIGVIPMALKKKEVVHGGLTELLTVSSMHQRKQIMADLSDGFIALPGGFGTMEELFESLAWNQLGIYSKPCGLLNVNQYYDALCHFIDTAVKQGFIRPRHRNLLLTATTPQALLDAMESRSSES